jgi:hypothetical protein
MIWHELDLSDDAKKTLDEIMERKKKLDDLVRNMNWHYFITLGSLVLFIFSFYNSIIRDSNGIVLDMIAKMSGNFLVLSFLVLFITFYAFTRNVTKKVTTAKSKLEALRVETIDRFKADWQKNMKSETRDAISAEMMEVCNVNLTFKS